MNKKIPKVFCVGWHKTGTSTMGDALILLGYNVVGARLDTAESLLSDNIDPVLKLAQKFDAFQDVPWAALYKELDERFPGSKFILTKRDDQKWLKSAVNHFGKMNRSRPMFKWLYGVGAIENNEKIFLNRYQRHNNEVQDYFKERPKDFLIMNFEKGDSWEKLCAFLDCEIPESKFPHSNKGEHSYSKHEKIIRKLKKFIPEQVRIIIFKLKLILLKPFGYKDPRNRFNNYFENRKAQKNIN